MQVSFREVYYTAIVTRTVMQILKLLNIKHRLVSFNNREQGRGQQKTRNYEKESNGNFRTKRYNN